MEASGRTRTFSTGRSVWSGQTSPVPTEDIDVTDLLHNMHLALDLPLWAKLLALAVVALSPLVAVKWRRGSSWHRSGK
jgi:hypothetical protein